MCNNIKNTIKAGIFNVISIINNKGGVGKTATTLILAELLAYLGFRVLVLDLDGQSNVSLTLHSYVKESLSSVSGRTAPEQENIFEVFVDRLKEKTEITRLIKHTNILGVDIIPSSNRFNNIEKNLEDCYKSPFILSKAIKAVKEDYDFVLIDNSPSMNFFTLNSIVASDYIITPVRSEDYSKKGVVEILDKLNQIKDEYDLDNVKFLGAFLTQADSRTNVYKECVQEYKDEIADKFFNTCIRRDTKIEQMQKKHIPMLQLSNDSNALIDYCNLLLEMDILPDEAKEKLIMSISA
ncbi:chromosome partitioning protein [Lacrimispora sphenoides]|uniref:ParA family protein n=1 Tax=Lacrimispora sphenoides TaxID=29370 RepID=UPI0008B40578|nr:AAA family ATPase [Lacrimispora sphenoides]SET42942.1 chromosome partitioning protein [Lacrimispora sphenoides]